MDEAFETRSEPPQTDSISGELVTEAFDYDEGRQVTAYVPPAPPKAIVFAGDGQMVSQWGRSLEAADVPSTMIVGVHRSSDESQRLREYSSKFDPERFAAHERFFVHDVAAWTRLRFGVKLCLEQTAVFDVSAGRELALALGILHPGSTARFSQRPPGQATGHLKQCPVDCLARTSWRAPGGLSSLTMLRDGRPHCAMQMQIS